MARILLLVFAPFATGYFLSYLFRNANAVIAGELTAELAIGPAELGLLTSAYLLCFGLFQLPLGLLLDRYGPRRVQAALLTVAGLGAIGFGLAESLPALTLARGVIGLGVSGCLMSSFIAVSLWFEPARWPLVNACVVAFGGAGAMAATAPFKKLVAAFGWREVFLGLGVTTLCVAALIFLVVPRGKERPPAGGLAEALTGIKTVFSSATFWRFAPTSVLCQASLISIIGLWAGPWLADVGGLDRDAVSRGLFAMAAGMTLGSLGCGLLADRLGRLGISLTSVMTWGTAAYILLQLLFMVPVDAGAAWPWVLFAASGNFSLMTYPILTGSFPRNLSGRVNTAINVFVFVIAFAIQWMIGQVLEFFPAADGSASFEGYRLAFALLWILQALAWSRMVLSRGERRAISS